MTAPPPAAGPSRLLSNTGWNIAGQLLPLLVGVAVLPLLIRTLGLDRYGFLTLVWVLVGYAGVFDFGLGRALIRVLALRLSQGDEAGAQHVARVGLGYLGLFGLGIGLVFALASAWLLDHVMQLPAVLHAEALQAMWLLAASLPFVMLTNGYVAVLSARQRFRGMNIVRAAMGITSYLGPLVVALWSTRLDAVVAFVLLMRVAATLAHAVLAAQSPLSALSADGGGVGFRYRFTRLDRTTSHALFSLGGWISVSNVVSPMLSYLDRLLLGALLPVRMAAFYATPSDLISKAMILPHALMAALFPVAAGVRSGSDAARQMLAHSMRLLFVLSFPVVFAFVALAQPGLQLWLGSEFAFHAAPVLRLLALGVFLNMLAQGPALLIQAAGQPRLMALLHLVELPVFLGLLTLLTLHWGLVGTALAAALRNGLDGVAVLVLARRDVARGQLAARKAVVPGVLAVALLGCAWWPRSLAEALVVLLVGWAVFGVYAWRALLRPEERSRLLGLIGLNGLRGLHKGRP